MTWARRDFADELSVWLNHALLIHEGKGGPINEPISAVLVSDALHEIRRLREVVGLASEHVQLVTLDEESLFCLRCQRVIHALERECHDCQPAPVGGRA